MNYYPVHICLQDKIVTIIGGGKIAQRKIALLLKTNATIIIISPSITQTIEDWVKKNKVEWRKKMFEPSDIIGSHLVFALTNNAEVNKGVLDATTSHQWVNIATDRNKSTFHVPAQIQQGPLSITVSTAGISPTISKNLVKQIKQTIPDNVIEHLQFLKRWRETIQQTIHHDEARHHLLRYLASDELLTAANREEKAHAAYCKVLKEYGDE